MKRAFTFGQNAVDQNAPDYEGWPGLLNGCVPDARDLAIASAAMGYEAQSHFSGWNVGGAAIPWVMSGQCTRGLWRELHQKWQAEAKAGDKFIIGNSGHGGRYDRPDQYDAGETLCFYDGLLCDYEQAEIMRGWPEGVSVLYVLDSCHSGGMDKAAPKGRPKVAPANIRPLVGLSRRRGPDDVKASILQFAACRADETASDGPQNGAFTGCLLAVWDQARARGVSLTYQQWMEETADLMADYFPTQHPVINVIGRGLDMVEEFAW